MTSPPRDYRVRTLVTFAGIVAFFVLLGSCHHETTTINLEPSVAEFRSQLDSEQYHAIYTGADDGLRKGANEQDFTALMQAVHRKLGQVQESHLLSRSEGWATGVGRLVTLVYNTKFAGGTGTEQFIWRIRENRAFLFGYHLNSNAMVTK